MVVVILIVDTIAIAIVMIVDIVVSAIVVMVWSKIMNQTIMNLISNQFCNFMFVQMMSILRFINNCRWCM